MYKTLKSYQVDLHVRLLCAVNDAICGKAVLTLPYSGRLTCKRWRRIILGSCQVQSRREDEQCAQGSNNPGSLTCDVHSEEDAHLDVVEEDERGEGGERGIVQHPRQHHVFEVREAVGLMDFGSQARVCDGHDLLEHHLVAQEGAVPLLLRQLRVILQRPHLIRQSRYEEFEFEEVGCLNKH